MEERIIENSKEKIINQNRKLGYETFFYNDDDGKEAYVIQNRIYLNTNCKNLEKINKCAVLKFFTGTDIFKKYKDIVFGAMKKNEYMDFYYNYQNIYYGYELSPCEFDDIMVIDIICGRGNIRKGLADVTKGMFDNIVKYGKENDNIQDYVI